MAKVVLKNLCDKQLRDVPYIVGTIYIIGYIMDLDLQRLFRFHVQCIAVLIG